MPIKTYIVEDSPTIRENLISTLAEMTDVTTVGFSDGESESVAWLTDGNHVWDLAIVDLFLKQGTGMKVIAACQKRLPNQKLIVLSNYATPDVRQQCLKLGADAVFDKSTEIELLLAFCNQLKKP